MSEAQKQRPHKLLWMLWFDGKSISSIHALGKSSTVTISEGPPPLSYDDEYVCLPFRLCVCNESVVCI